ncbi:MAG: pyridoxamine kinase [Acutalibacteraceae bacterium]|nr:pyridoxamine kinase [Acutalibacteraceae bacterium]
MENQKRLVAINDISGFGKCSLTVALPVISAAGVETICMPTAVLSTHTGGFTGYTYRDLTCDMPDISAHWKSIDLKPDAIYSGFLGSFDQIDIVKKFAEDFKREDNLFIADPCMADHGKMYAIFDKKFAKAMAELCSKADIILPNITEACFMTETEFVSGLHTEKYIETLLNKLLDMGAKNVILTGVTFEEDKLGAVFMGQDRVAKYYFQERLPGMYHGTGDVFASSFCGAILNGISYYDAMGIAVRYVCDCIKRTQSMENPITYGVDFERGIPFYIKELGKI